MRIKSGKTRRGYRGLLVVPVVLCLLFSMVSCRENEDFLDVFRAGFSAEIEGTLPELSFSGELCAEPAEYREDGTARPFCGTFTFYAPESLAGTTLSRDREGALFLTAGELTVPLSQDSDFAAIFALFPVAGNVRTAKVNGEGQTELTGDGFSLVFLSGGVPLSANTGNVSAKIVRFETTASDGEGGK